VVGLALLDSDAGPLQVLGDTAYGSASARAGLAAAGHTAVIKPGPLRPAVAGGFTQPRPAARRRQQLDHRGTGLNPRRESLPGLPSRATTT
jgi:hypothetical protein